MAVNPGGGDQAGAAWHQAMARDAGAGTDVGRRAVTPRLRNI